MHELRAILAGLGAARARGERCALATVVAVSGSAYRRPGARMLIAEGGATVGAISGGCLERDLAERAGAVVDARSAIIVEYDTSRDDDVIWGVGLGCDGVVHILLESLHEDGDADRALRFAADCLDSRAPGVVATRLGGRPGHRAAFDGEGQPVELDRGTDTGSTESAFADAAFAARVTSAAREALASRRSTTRRVEGSDESAMDVFFDVVVPPVALVVFGAEHDALPLVRFAGELGWDVTLVDTRARRATTERFAAADRVLLCRADDVAARVPVEPGAAVVVMTHNYLDDAAILGPLLASPAAYLGVLGPKRRTERLLADLRAGGFEPTAAQLARLHGPVGIDAGAETPSEVALSIVAEIQAVRSGRGAGFLRDRRAPIHDAAAGAADARGDAAEAIASPEARVEPAPEGAERGRRACDVG